MTGVSHRSPFREIMSLVISPVTSSHYHALQGLSLGLYF